MFSKVKDPGYLDFFLFFSSESGFILADSPGMGKTVTTASLLARIKMSAEHFRVLVVCKNILLQQWRKEIQKWTKLRTSFIPFDVKERVCLIFYSRF